MTILNTELMQGYIILFLLLRSVLGESRKLGKSLQTIDQELQAEIQDQLYGIREIKSYGIEALQMEHFARTAQKVEENVVRFTKVQLNPDIFYKTGAAVIISIFFMPPICRLSGVIERYRYGTTGGFIYTY